MINILDFIFAAVFFGVCFVLTGLFTIFIYPILFLRKTLSSGRLKSRPFDDNVLRIK
jgi:hypothetical protein